MSLEANGSAYGQIICYDDTCQGNPPFSIFMYGAADVFSYVLVIVPHDGFVSFETVVDGQSLGTTVLSVAAGTHQIDQISFGAFASLSLFEIGSVSYEQHRTMELRNIQLRPEPGSLWLVGLALAALPFSRFRRH